MKRKRKKKAIIAITFILPFDTPTLLCYSQIIQHNSALLAYLERKGGFNMDWDEYRELVNSAEQKWRNQYVLTNYPGTKLSKVNIDHLEEILGAVEAVVSKERIGISHWDIGLAAVGVGGITEAELTQILKRLKTNLETRRTWNWNDSFHHQTLYIYICEVWGLKHSDYENSPTWPEIDKP